MRMAKLDNKNRFELLVAAGTQKGTSINQAYLLAIQNPGRRRFLEHVHQR